ncbi:hypothetical protein Tco_1310610 [Tanacetum coccineum]
MDDDKKKEELKQCFEIVSDDGDDVTIDATPLLKKILIPLVQKLRLLVEVTAAQEVQALIKEFVAMEYLILVSLVCATAGILIAWSLFLEGTLVAGLILMMGHNDPSMLNIHPIGFHLSPTELKTLPVGFQ